jgi:putative membrane protein
VEDALIRYLHFLGILVFVGGLVVELFLLSDEVSAKDMRKIASADAMCGMSFLLILISGLLLWLVVGKPAEFYSDNIVFHIKLLLVTLTLLLAISPALFFIRARNSKAAKVSVPARIMMQVRAEVVLLLFVPLMAVLMATGYGNG